MEIIIAGAGASGLMAAIKAAETGANVTLLEHNTVVGKKILSTGNGRCNLTNMYMEASCFHSNENTFPMRIINQFDEKKTMDFFAEIGLMLKSRNGYIYPNSDQASSVSDVLKMEAEHRGVCIITGCNVTKASKKDHDFVVETNCHKYRCQKLILATGSKAASKSGSDGSGYALAKEFGHKIITPLPALVQLRCAEKFYKQLAGIRTEALIKLYDGQNLIAQDRGELQLTDYGISGIPVFQISRYASEKLRNGGNVTAVIDFLPDVEQNELDQMLLERTNLFSYRTVSDMLTGVLNKKLLNVLLKLAGIQKDERAEDVKSRQLEQLKILIKTFRTTVVNTNPFENAQVCCGGVDTKQLTENMESRLVPGLFIIGELADVDGICGGYNLQWAWSSGAVAGKWAGRIQ